MSARDPVVRELQVPGTVLRRLATRFPDRYPVLLDSAAEGLLSQVSMLASEPQGALWSDAAGRIGASGTAPSPSGGFLESLERWWARQRTAPSVAPLPFVGGWAIFLGYELASEIEPRLRLPPSELPWQAFALRTPCALIHERRLDRVLAVAEAEYAHLLDRVASDAHAAASAAPEVQQCLPVASLSEEPAHAFLERVRRARNTFAPATSTRPIFRAPGVSSLPRTPAVAALYERLRAANPAPFAALRAAGRVSRFSAPRPNGWCASRDGADSNAADRRHAAAQRHAGGDDSRDGASCRRIRRSAPSTSC